ncbi:lysozyme [Pseudomonadota bacterium]
MRKINNTGLVLIKKYEGFSRYIYLCPASFPTIGYGHLCKENDLYLTNLNLKIEQIKHILKKNNGYSKQFKEQTKITLFEAENLLKKDLKIAELAVLRLIKTPLTDNQFSALVSFTFNLGSSALQRSTLRRKLNRGEYKIASMEFGKWVYADEKRLRGLIKRRKEEMLLFNFK